jgi:threonine/homoserine/homoserine lactone efflux protein
VQRPTVPPEATRQLELMKVVDFDKEPQSRSVGAVFGLLSLPIFAVVFFLLYRLVARTQPTAAVLILVAGLGFLGYLVWTFLRSRGAR